MGHTRSVVFWSSKAAHRPAHSEDPLREMRGIIFVTLVSIVGLWLPLAWLLAR